MNYPIINKTIDNHIILRFLLDQYKLIMCNNLLYNNKLVTLWFIYTYSSINNLKRNLNPILYTIIKKNLKSNIILHQTWLIFNNKKTYNLSVSNNSKLSIFSILPKKNLTRFYQKLYITTVCFNTNRLILSIFMTKNQNSNFTKIKAFNTNTYLYYLKLLSYNNLLRYNIHLYYIHFINKMYIIQWDRVSHFSIKQVTNTKKLTTHNLIHHHLINL